jgi:hypothetical protein
VVFKDSSRSHVIDHIYFLKFEQDSIAFDSTEKTITILQMQALENQNMTISVPMENIQVMEPLLAPFDLGQWQFTPNSTEAGERGAKISMLVQNDGHETGQFREILPPAHQLMHPFFSSQKDHNLMKTYNE